MVLFFIYELNPMIDKTNSLVGWGTIYIFQQKLLTKQNNWYQWMYSDQRFFPDTGIMKFNAICHIIILKELIDLAFFCS